MPGRVSSRGVPCDFGAEGEIWQRGWREKWWVSVLPWVCIEALGEVMEGVASTLVRQTGATNTRVHTHAGSRYPTQTAFVTLLFSKFM